MYQNLPLCRKHGSYTCRAIFRNLVGNIPTLLNFGRKIPTHSTMCRTFGIIPTSVGIIPTFVGTIPTLVGMIPMLVRIIPTPQDVLHFAQCIGISLTKFNSVHGNIPTKFCKNSQ